MRTGTRVAGCEPPGLDPPGETSSPGPAGCGGVSVTEEGFQAEPLLLADPEAGVGECVVEDLGKGVRSGGAMSEE